MTSVSVANIQMVDLFSQYQRLKDDIDAGMKEVIQTSQYINGSAVKSFKQELQEYLNVKHVIPCANGTDALQLALMALDLKPGDEVITSSFTFIATAEVIALLHLKPVFVDVYDDTFNIDVSAVEAAITDKTKVILPVHIFGQTADMEPLLELANKHQLFVVEDTAQAIGSKYTFKDGSQKFAGTIGDIGTTSFFPSKNLGCFGDGGAVFTNNDELASKLTQIANHGSKVKYYHDLIGVNSRLDSLQAAVLRVKLRELDDFSFRRNTAAKFYCDQLADISWLVMPKINDNTTHVFHQFTMKVTNGRRDELQKYLQEFGIPSMVYYPVPLHKQNAFKQFSEAQTLKVSDELSEQVISLPMHTELTDDQLGFICKKIKEFK